MEDRELIVKTSAYIDRHRDEMLSLWEKIVSIESGTPDKEGVDRVGAVLKDELESAGVETAVIPMERFGNLLTGVWNKEAAGQPIVLIGHMDTVFAKGTLEKNPFRIDANGNAHGPGVLDMKAGLVIAVYVLKALDTGNARSALSLREMRRTDTVRQMRRQRSGNSARDARRHSILRRDLSMTDSLSEEKVPAA